VFCQLRRFEQSSMLSTKQLARDRALQNLADLRRAPAETVQFLQSVSGEARQMESQDRSG
jgi:hypothetical protein